MRLLPHPPGSCRCSAALSRCSGCCWPDAISGRITANRWRKFRRSGGPPRQARKPSGLRPIGGAGFDSSTLNALIAAARAQNFDIVAAIARVRQADAQVRIAGVPLLPTLDATGSASWQQVSLSRRSFTTGTSSTGSVATTGSTGAYTDVRQYG